MVLAARRTERHKALASELACFLATTTDVTDVAQVKAIVAQTFDVFGRVDVLVDDAGQGLHVPLEQLDPVDLRAAFELNAIGPFTGMQAVLPPTPAQGSGSIVNVSSLTSLRVLLGLGGYAATKGALDILPRVVRLEYASAGIAVSVVYPGVADTEFHDRLRSGHIVGGGCTAQPDPLELAARAA